MPKAYSGQKKNPTEFSIKGGGYFCFLVTKTEKSSRDTYWMSRNESGKELPSRNDDTEGVKVGPSHSLNVTLRLLASPKMPSLWNASIRVTVPSTPFRTTFLLSSTVPSFARKNTHILLVCSFLLSLSFRPSHESARWVGHHMASIRVFSDGGHRPKDMSWEPAATGKVSYPEGTEMILTDHATAAGHLGSSLTLHTVSVTSLPYNLSGSPTLNTMHCLCRALLALKTKKHKLSGLPRVYGQMSFMELKGIDLTLPPVMDPCLSMFTFLPVELRVSEEVAWC